MFRPLPIAALALCAAGSAAAQQTIPFSGYELFPGINSGEVVAGVIFVGWTTPDAAIWYPPSAQTGGFWAASVNRVGAAGIGDQGFIESGRWIAQLPDGTRVIGTAACDIGAGNCTVTWPATLDGDIGCGAGIGRFHVELAIEEPEGGGTGAMDGCLDDTHLTTVFPPQVWGTLTLHASPPMEGAAAVVP